jgi:hypothetical protein
MARCLNFKGITSADDTSGARNNMAREAFSFQADGKPTIFMRGSARK